MGVRQSERNDGRIDDDEYEARLGRRGWYFLRSRGPGKDTRSPVGWVRGDIDERASGVVRKVNFNKQR